MKLNWSFESVQVYWEHQEEMLFLHTLTKSDDNNSFFIAFIFWKILSLVTYVDYNWYVVVKLFKIYRTSRKFKMDISDSPVPEKRSYLNFSKICDS